MNINKLDTYGPESISQKYTKPLRGLLGGRNITQISNRGFQYEKIMSVAQKALFAIAMTISGIGLIYLLTAAVVLAASTKPAVLAAANNQINQQPIQQTIIDRTTPVHLNDSEEEDENSSPRVVDLTIPLDDPEEEQNRREMINLMRGEEVYPRVTPQRNREPIRKNVNDLTTPLEDPEEERIRLETLDFIMEKEPRVVLLDDSEEEIETDDKTVSNQVPLKDLHELRNQIMKELKKAIWDESEILDLMEEHAKLCQNNPLELLLTWESILKQMALFLSRTIEDHAACKDVLKLTISILGFMPNWTPHYLSREEEVISNNVQNLIQTLTRVCFERKQIDGEYKKALIAFNKNQNIFELDTTKRRLEIRVAYLKLSLEDELE
jgi:hypothetical protein